MWREQIIWCILYDHADFGSQGMYIYYRNYILISLMYNSHSINWTVFHTVQIVQCAKGPEHPCSSLNQSIKNGFFSYHITQVHQRAQNALLHSTQDGTLMNLAHREQSSGTAEEVLQKTPAENTQFHIIFSSIFRTVSH